MTYLIEYFGEFEFIFETVLGYVSGDQMGYFEAKKRSRKSDAWAPLMVAHLAVKQQSLVRIWLLPSQRQILLIPKWIATWDGTVPWAGLRGATEKHKYIRLKKQNKKQVEV